MPSFSPAGLTDDELRLAVIEARRRLPHHEICTHCEDEWIRHRDVALANLREALTFNEHAATAGFVIGSTRGIVHQWDCSSIKTYVRSVVEVAEYVVSSDDDVVLRNGVHLRLPEIVTAAKARELLSQPSPRRATCQICTPHI